MIQEVSIIIPVYNVAPYLREALDSVISQTYKELQILIIDDGSTDDSGPICDEYTADPRVTVIHRENRGLSTARNVGLDLATGELIAFLDPDDAFDPVFIEELLRAINREQVDIAMCRYTVQKTESTLIPGRGSSRRSRGKTRHRPEPRADQGIYDRISSLRLTVDGAINCSVWNKLYKAALWKTIRFPDGHNYEDTETTYRVLDICSSITVIDTPLYYHRQRAGSITQTMSQKNIDDRILALKHLEEYVKRNTPEIFREEQVQRIRSSGLNGLMVYYIAAGRSEDNNIDPTVRADLRKEIIETGRKIGVENITKRSRAAYNMIRFCPWMLKIAYPIYVPLRLLVLRVTGR